MEQIYASIYRSPKPPVRNYELMIYPQQDTSQRSRAHISDITQILTIHYYPLNRWEVEQSHLIGVIWLLLQLTRTVSGSDGMRLS